MDYETKPTSRKDLRQYAKFVRYLFNFPATGPFPVLDVLDRLGDVFPNCSYIIVEDKAFPPQTMARCIPNDTGGYTIEIRQSVYDGAYEKHVGAFQGFVSKDFTSLRAVS